MLCQPPSEALTDQNTILSDKSDNSHSFVKKILLIALCLKYKLRDYIGTSTVSVQMLQSNQVFWQYQAVSGSIR